MKKEMFPRESDVPSEIQVPQIEGRILIGGKIESSGFDRKAVFSPIAFRNQKEDLEYPQLGTTPNVTPEKMLEAGEAASRAWDKGRGPWPTARMEDRIKAIQKFRDAVLGKRELISKLLLWEIAKSWKDATAEFDRTIKYIDDTLEAVKDLDRKTSQIQFSDGIMAQLRRRPLGVTLCVGPFNYPFNETFATLIPALIMGNPVVIKLPRIGKLLWDPLLEDFRDLFPPGVVNVVNGSGSKIIEPLVQSAKVDVLAFIGSSAVANKIKQAHPRRHRFRAVLGLDAKNPAIVLPDADLDNAVSECVRGSLSYNGQRCTALKILFVHHSIAERFVNQFVARVNALKIGMPWEKGVEITPLPDEEQLKKMNSYVEDALQKGAELCNPKEGGKSVGTLFFPAVLKNVPLDSKLGSEEQFGPVVPISIFESVEEVLDYIAESPFGMQASLFGFDPSILGELIDKLSNQVCRINLNAQCQRGPDVFPFTGRKNSAEGTLSVTDALRQFSIRSMVAAKQDEPGRKVMRDILRGDYSTFLSNDVVL